MYGNTVAIFCATCSVVFPSNSDSIKSEYKFEVSISKVDSYNFQVYQAQMKFLKQNNVLCTTTLCYS